MSEEEEEEFMAIFGGEPCSAEELAAFTAEVAAKADATRERLDRLQSRSVTHEPYQL